MKWSHICFMETWPFILGASRTLSHRNITTSSRPPLTWNPRWAGWSRCTCGHLWTPSSGRRSCPALCPSSSRRQGTLKGKWWFKWGHYKLVCLYSVLKSAPSGTTPVKTSLRYSLESSYNVNSSNKVNWLRYCYSQIHWMRVYIAYQCCGIWKKWI